MMSTYVARSFADLKTFLLNYRAVHDRCFPTLTSMLSLRLEVGHPGAMAAKRRFTFFSTLVDRKTYLHHMV